MHSKKATCQFGFNTVHSTIACVHILPMAKNNLQSEPPEPDALRAWLRLAIEKSGLKPTPFAHKANIAPSTIIRALEAGVPLHMSTRTIEKICNEFGVPLPGQVTAINRPNGFRDEAVPLDPDGEDDPEGPGVTQGDWEIATRALDLAGLLPGDKVRADSTVRPRADDIVCVQILNARGGADTVFRLYDPPYVVTRTSDPAAHRKPLPVDDDHVSIWGVVIRTWRERQP